jgi:hypothetical protein
VSPLAKGPAAAHLNKPLRPSAACESAKLQKTLVELKSLTRDHWSSFFARPHPLVIKTPPCLSILRGQAVMMPANTAVNLWSFQRHHTQIGLNFTFGMKMFRNVFFQTSGEKTQKNTIAHLPTSISLRKKKVCQPRLAKAFSFFISAVELKLT